MDVESELDRGGLIIGGVLVTGRVDLGLSSLINVFNPVAVVLTAPP